MALSSRVLFGVFAAVGCGFILSADVDAAGSYTPLRNDPVEESWRWRSFRELEGQGLSCLTEGPDGSVLFGTDEGIRVYNGLRWGLYGREDGLVGTPVNTLLTTKAGAIYAGTETSLHKFDGSNWNVIFPPEGDLHWRFTDLEEGVDGSIWAATNWGALNIDKGKYYLYTTDAIGRSVRDIAKYLRYSVVPEEYVPERSILSRVGMLSAPAGPDGVADNLHIYAVIDAGPADQAGIKPGDRIAAVDGQRMMDPNTALIGPPGTVVSLEITREGSDSPLNFEVIRDEVEETFRPFAVHDVMTAKDGSVWFGLESGEILRFQYLLKGKGATGLWRLFTEADGLGIGDLPRIGQSPDGQIWTGSYNQQGGLNRFDGGRWHQMRLSSLGGSDLNTSFAVTADGSFWVGGNSLNVLRSGTWYTYNDPELIPTQRTRLLPTSDGALWVAGSGQHVSRLSLQSTRWGGYRGLHFQTETEDNAQWFLSDDNDIVRFDGVSWIRYGTDDEVVQFPSAIFSTKSGDVWVIGSHEGSAATGQFDGTRFKRSIHAQLSWNIDLRAYLEGQDGSIWLGAWVDFDVEAGQVGGLLQYKDGQWKHHRPLDAPEFAYGITQTKDGLLWISGEEMRLFDGTFWI